jgi:hypothetical protein
MDRSRASVSAPSVGCERREAFAQQRHHPLAGAHAVVVAAQAWIGRQVIEG